MNDEIVIDKGIRKLHRDGKVAVLISPGFGAGWSTWNTSDIRDNENAQVECLFCPEIVKLVEEKANSDTIDRKANELWGDEFCAGGSNQLKVEWLSKGSQFYVKEYDGSESLVTSQSWITA